MPAGEFRPFTFRARGLSDARDASNAFAGAMAVLQNLIPDTKTDGIFVPRPAALGLAGSGANPTIWGSFLWGDALWGGFDDISGAAQINALMALGNVVYGMIASTSGVYAGKDVPYAFNLLTLSFLPITIPGGAASLPDTPSATGDWTPPTMAAIASRIVVTHPGFTGGANPFFGWLDVSGFSDVTKTGDTHTSTLIDNLSANVLNAGWQVGMTITGAGIDTDTTIVTIAPGGLSITVSKATLATAAGVALTVDGGSATAPLWGSGNTNTNPLLAVPVAVHNFNARAYYAVPGGGIAFSDAGSACERTQATQALLPRNGLNVTAFGGLPFQQSQGGILQALIAFQGGSSMQQITGDPVTNNLAMNALGVGVGCIAPNTICSTPMGLTFVAPDGVRAINFVGQISDPIGKGGTGVVTPFLNAVSPSRMCAAYNQDVLRVSVKNGAMPMQPVQEYWYHVSRKIWSGPHTLPAALIQPDQSSNSQGFIMAAFGVPAQLWTSQVTPTVTSSYTENGQVLQCSWQPVLLPDTEQMAENLIVQTTLGLTLPALANLTVGCYNEGGVQLNAVNLAGPPANNTVWGSFLWGQAPWGATTGFFAQYDVPWTTQLVFKQGSFIINCFAVADLAIGNIYLAYKPLGYRLQAMAPVTGGLR